MLYNKVEICGINTTKLPVISEKRKKELLETIHHGKPIQAKSARDEMINGNLRLVLSVVQRFGSRGENPDDLFQVGCIGLIKAIDNFNADKDVCFSTYGVPMIIGEIRRYLRDYNPIRVSRSIRDTAYHAMNVKEKFTIQNNREPTIPEIAKILWILKTWRKNTDGTPAYFHSGACPGNLCHRHHRRHLAPQPVLRADGHRACPERGEPLLYRVLEDVPCRREPRGPDCALVHHCDCRGGSVCRLCDGHPDFPQP